MNTTMGIAAVFAAPKVCNEEYFSNFTDSPELAKYLAWKVQQAQRETNVR